MKNNLISLEDLALKPYPIFFDTSALLSHYASKGKPQTLTGKFNQAKELYDFSILMKDYVKNGSNFYITRSVSEELQKGVSPSIKKSIKGYCKDREFLRLCRKRRESSKAQRSLDRTFQENNKIIQFTGNKQISYDLTYNKGLEIKEKYGLTYTIFDLLISAIDFAKTNGTVGLVSNKKDISFALRDLLKNERIRSRSVKLFVRESFLDFKKMY